MYGACGMEYIVSMWSTSAREETYGQDNKVKTWTKIKMGMEKDSNCSQIMTWRGPRVRHTILNRSTNYSIEINME
jgi:hypothetical protein